MSSPASGRNGFVHGHRLSRHQPWPTACLGAVRLLLQRRSQQSIDDDKVHIQDQDDRANGDAMDVEMQRLRDSEASLMYLIYIHVVSFRTSGLSF